MEKSRSIRIPPTPIRRGAIRVIEKIIHDALLSFPMTEELILWSMSS
jgi:hypothetical protein